MLPKISDTFKNVLTCKKGIRIYVIPWSYEHKSSIAEGRGYLDYFSFMQQDTST